MEVEGNMNEARLEDIESIFSSFEDVDYSAMNRESEQYRKAQVLNKAKREETNSRHEDPLTKALSEATHLDDKLKERFVYLANIYTSDMEINIFRNQFQLSREYGEVSADEWNDFLADRIVSTYLQKHKRTLLKAAAEDNLSDPTSRNKRDSLKLIENLQAQEQAEAEKNVVILRIPNVYDE